MQAIFVYIFFLALWLFSGYAVADAQNITAKGKRFWVGFMQNVGNPEDPDQGVNLSVYISATNVGTSGTVSVPAQGWSQNFTVTANTTTQVVIPTFLAHASISETILDGGVLVTANDSVNVFALNDQQYSTDASIVLPENALREDYYVVAYDESLPNQYPSELIVVAPKDNTQVEITPKVSTAQGKPAGVPFTVTLNAGQTYLVQASNGDLSGTRIRAVGTQCRAFAVFAGHRCTNLGDCPNCDHVFEQMFPLNTLGQEYIAVPSLSREKDLLRILATQNNTTVTVSGGGSFTLNAGQYNATPISVVNSVHFKANKPVMAAQYTRSACCDQINAQACNDNFGFRYGDPYMLVLSPIEQMVIKQATVNAFNMATIDSSYINITTRTANKNLVTLDGVNIGASFTAVPSAGQYSTARRKVAKGNHVIRSDSGFVAFGYAFGERISYGYSADAVLNNIALKITTDVATTPAICPSTPIKFTGQATTDVQSWSWKFGDGATANGQTADHTYNTPGTYTVKVFVQRDGVCAEDSTIREIIIKGPNITATKTDVVCNGQNNGAIIISGANGSEPYTFALNNGAFQSSGSFSSLAAGDYTVKVRDAAGCLSTKTVTLSQPQALTVTLTATNISCFSMKDGKITSSVTGGNAPYTYLWSNQETGTFIDSLDAGTYSLAVKDSKGCTITSADKTITEPAAPIFGSNDPCLQTIQLNKDKLTQMYKQGLLPPFPQITNAAEQNACGAIPVCQQTYTQTQPYIGNGAVMDITDNSTCLQQGEKNSVWYTFTVQNSGPFGFTLTAAQDYDFALYNVTGKSCTDIPTMTPVRCNYASSLGPGNTTGMNASNVQAGNLSEGAGGNPVMPGMNVTAGQTYMLLISKFAEQEIGYTLALTGTSTVFDTQVPKVLTITSSAVKCSGKFGPKITITFNERVKCSTIQTSDFVITGPGGAITLNSINCGPDSAVTSITLNIAEQSTVGTYNVRIVGNITDLCGNALEVPLNRAFTISTPLAAQAVEIVNPCPGATTGSFKVNVTGGVPPYTYSKNDGIPQASNSFTGLGVGNYKIKVTDADTCSVTIFVNITSAATSVDVMPNVVKNPSCNGFSDGSIDIKVTGGTSPYTFVWSNGKITEDITNLAAGTYKVTATDAAGCTDTLSVTLTQPAVLAISTFTKGNESCVGASNGFIDITLAGGTTPYTYAWSNNAVTEDLTAIPAGSYKVKVTDAKGCTVESQSIQITSEAAPPAPLATASAVCGGGAATLTGTSTVQGAVFMWYTSPDGPSVFTGNPYTTPPLNQTTVYYVRIKVGVCMSELTLLTVSVNTIPGVTATAQGPTTFCIGKSVVLTTPGGFSSYQWFRNNVAIANSNSTSITATLGGSYTVKVTDSNNCTGTSNAITVTLTNPPTLTLVPTAVACKNSNTGSITLTVNGSGAPYKYSWSNTATTKDITNLAAGTYSVTVTDSFGCVVTSQATAVNSSTDSCISGVVNKYTTVLEIDPCTNSARLNSTSDMKVGAKVLMIQMNGATVDLTNTVNFGKVTNLNDAGNYEFAIISAINGNKVTFQNQLSRTYDVANAVQLITVPIYTNVANPSALQAQAWDGATGGVLVFEATNLTLGANIDVSGLGFRGGLSGVNGSNACTNTDYFVGAATGNGALKGEGIVRLPGPNGAGRGPAANGGGGGNLHNAGGGGGSNAGFGGQGGNEWEGCSNSSIGGMGGLGLTYSNTTNRVFFGGGGGGGHQNGGNGTAGGNGGGLVIIKANTLVGGGKTITADGLAAATATDDASGGAGAGGAVLLNVQTYTGSLNVTAKGGKGGDNGSPKCHGPGGGGGGGTVWSNTALPGTVTATVTGGTQGTVTNNASTCFGSNYGASAGANGTKLTGLQVPLSSTPFTPPTVTVTVTGATTFCSGDSVRLQATGNFSTYTWKDGNGQIVSTTATYFAKTSGSYAVFAASGQSCKDTSDVTVVTVNPTPVIATEQTNPSCTGGGASTGSITTTVTGGTPNYTYLWSNGQSTANLTNLAPGTYSLTVTDSKSCKAKKSVTITSPSSFACNLTIKNPTSPLAFDGKITVTVSGGTPGYTYSLNGATPQTSNVFNNLAPISYTVVTLDTNGCKCIASVQLTAPCVFPDSVWVDDIQATTATAHWTKMPNATTYNIGWHKFGSTDPFINATVTDTFKIIPNLTPQTKYEFIIQTVCGSPKSGWDTIIFFTPPLCNKPVSNTYKVCGADSVSLSAASNQQDAQFVWYADAVAGSVIHTGKPYKIYATQTDTFYVAVRRTSSGFGSCESERTPVIVKVFPKASIEILATDVSCKTRQDGAINVNIIGGTTPYQFAWSNGETTEDIDSLAKGNYVLTVTDSNGCVTKTPTIVIKLVNEATTLAFQILGDASAIDSTCFRITPAQNNKAGAVWNNNKFNLNFGFDLEYIVNLGANDANGADGIAFVLQNSGSGSIGATGQGLGYGGISPSVAVELDTWDNGAGDIACDHTSINLNGAAATPSAGPIQALAGNCNIEDGTDHLFRVVWKPDPKKLQVYIDGSLRLEYTVDLLNNVFGGNNQVFWGFTGSTGGSLNDQKICIKRTDVICPCEAYKPVVTASGPTSFCSGGNVSFSAPNGYVLYQWSTGATGKTITVNETGFYHVTVTDTNECEGRSDTIFVKVNDPIFVTLDKTNVKCKNAADGAITANVSGGSKPYKYLWSTGETTQTIDSLAPGSFSVVVTDSVGCTITQATNIIQPNQALNFSFVRVNPTSPYASDGKIYITPTGGGSPYQYSKDGTTYTNYSPGVPLSGLLAGTYQVHVKDANGCIKIKPVTLIAPCVAPITITDTLITNHSAVIKWDSLPNAERYLVGYRRKNTPDNWTNRTVLAPTHQITLDPLLPDVLYEFRIRTRCTNGGLSPLYNYHSFTTLPDSICPTPTGLHAYNTSEDTADVSWTSVNEAVKYELQYRLKGTTIWKSDTVWALDTTLYGLEANKKYEIRIRSFCVDNQTSAYSSIDEFIAKFQCHAPGELTVQVDTFFAIARWKAAPGATKYIVGYRKKNSGQDWSNTTVNAPQDTFLMGNLEPGVAYEFRVLSKCPGFGSVDTSYYDFTTIFKAICPPVTGLTFTNVSETEATVSWTSGSALNDLYQIKYRLKGSTGDWSVIFTADLTVTLINLLGGETYEVCVLANCTDGSAPIARCKDLETIFVCHGILIDSLVIQVDTFSAVAKWQTVRGATQYDISYRPKETGAIWTNSIVTAPDTTKTILNLTPGKTYEFRVIVQCSTLTAADTVIQEFTTIDKPSCLKPTITISPSSVTDTSAVVSWVAIPNAFQYILHYNTIPGQSPQEKILENTVTSIQLHPLEPGSTYRVTIETSCDNGLFSGVTDSNAHVFTTLYICQGPVDVVIEPDSFFANISWKKSYSANSYNLSWRVKGSTAPWINTLIDTPAVAFSITNLTPGVEYEFCMSANCESLVSDTFCTTFITKFQPTCPAPDTLMFSDITATDAKVKWFTIPGTINYFVEYRVKGTSVWSTPIFVADPDTATTFLNGLLPGRTYEVRVGTQCSGLPDGTGSKWEFTTLFICQAPLITINPDILSANVSWDPVFGASAYALSWRVLGSGTPWVNTELDTPAVSFDIPNLTPDTEYEFRISTICDDLFSDTTITSFITDVMPPCYAPTVFSFENIDETTATVSWTPTVGSDEYFPEYRLKGETEWIPLLSTVDPFVDLTGLTPGATYEVRVLAHCGDLFSFYSPTKEFTTLFVCRTPSLVSLTPDSTKATFTWTEPFKPVSYVIRWRQTPDGAWRSDTTAAPASGYVITGLSDGTAYEAELWTLCDGSRSDTIAFTFTTLINCVAPASITISAITENSATVSWPANTDALAFELEYRVTGAPNWTKVSVSGNSKTLQNLSPGVTYEVRVRATCAETVFSPYTLNYPFTTKTQCPVPTVTTVTPSITTATVNWTAVANADKYFISYRISGSGTSNVVSVNGPTPANTTLIGLVANTNYLVKVRARCGNITTNYSAETAFKTKAAKEAGTLAEETTDISLKLYPNPNNGAFTLEMETDADAPVTLKVWDAAGRVVLEHSLDAVSGFNEWALDLTDEAAGVYQLEVLQGDKSRRARVIIR